MGFLDEVRADRQPLAHVLKKHRGIRKIVEDLYPDRAHFIYELLQNAEDKGATHADFSLTSTALIFEHDGTPFTEPDIWGITDIGEGTKEGQEDKIGKFGVGFKAVFAYCEVPKIWSPTFSFAITDLVLPTELQPKPRLGNDTRFEFEFNNPKKSPNDAYIEVKAGLMALAETTLLFLRNLKSISWSIDGQAFGKVTRVQHSEYHFEVVRRTPEETKNSSHFLIFEQAVEGLPAQKVAVAFALDLLPNSMKFDVRESLAIQMRIVPAAPGRVAVFFPAEKELSGLRFHLHAPFVPELSRASIKESPANAPLFTQIAKVAAASLHRIREMGLLASDFLAVLPNTQDALPERYHSIRSAIIREMNECPLTPTHAKSHAPAKHLRQAKASLKDLLTIEDMQFLTKSTGEPLQWAMGATQKNTNTDRFLAALQISNWDVEEFVRCLRDHASEGWRYASSLSRWTSDPDDDFMFWLSNKSIDWHQRLYSFLYAELSATGRCKDLQNVRLVRLADGKYSTGNNCFFAGDAVGYDDALPPVDGGVYTTGRSKLTQENARKFLAEIGVREIGEKEQVEAILKLRYTSADFKPRKQDLKRFIVLVEKDPEQAKLFSNYFIFEGSDGKWRTPGGIFLDEPFVNSGLASYYTALGKAGKRVALAQAYEDFGISMKRLAKFAETVGAQMKLEITIVSCVENPQWTYLASVSGDRYTSKIDRDFTIPGLKQILSKPRLDISRLIWQTLVTTPQHPNYLRAQYQKSQQWGAHYADSQLVHILRGMSWIPQTDGRFVSPHEASRDLLPVGFPFDPGWPWLKAMQFGDDEQQKADEEQRKAETARELGFADPETLQRARQFATLPPAEQERILAEIGRMQAVELPDREPHDPGLRAQRVARQAAQAPPKKSEESTRAVQVGLDDVKQQAAEYLQSQYVTEGEMICQICKTVLPFKLPDGGYYFEKVEFITDLHNRYYQNYLALCPNHAAMFQHANGSKRSLKESFVGIVTQQLDVVLAEKDLTIYFTKTHLADMKEIIKVDAASHEPLAKANIVEGAS